MGLTNIFLFIALSGVAMGEDKIATVKQGDPAPFDGTLFSESAAAKLVVDMKAFDEACTIKVDNAVAIENANSFHSLEISRIEKETQKEMHEEIIRIKDDTIWRNEKLLDKSRGPASAIWFGAGVGAGIGLTALSAWSLSQIAQ